MRVILLILILALMGCSSTPMPSATAAWTVTATPAATNTARPTDLPSPTATAVPAPSETPTATPEPTATARPVAQVGDATWRRLATAAMTVYLGRSLEEMAQGVIDGTLTSDQVAGQAMGMRIMMGVLANELDAAPSPVLLAGYDRRLRANLAGLYDLLDRWSRNEVYADTMGPELATLRERAEQVLSELAWLAGWSDAQVDELIETMSTTAE